MKKYLWFIFISLLVGIFMVGCSEQPYYEIPTDEDGNPIVTKVSESSTDGVTLLDDEFTVVANFENCDPGDEFQVEVLKEQEKEGEMQLLPLEGTQKTVTADDNLVASVTYTRAEAELEEIGDYCMVTFGGETESEQQGVTLRSAMTVRPPEVLGNAVDVMHIDDTASFPVIVEPANFDYTGEVSVQWKSESQDSWNDLDDFTVSNDSAAVPVNGWNHSQGETIYYHFEVESPTGNVEVAEASFVVGRPQFFQRRTASLKIESEQDSTQAGIHPVSGDYVEDKGSAPLSINSDLELEGGEDWLAEGNTIEFVPTDKDTYDTNNSSDAIDAFEAAAPGEIETSIDPKQDRYAIFRIDTGENTFYGMLNVTNISLGESVTFDYLIGNKYHHLNLMYQ